MATTPRAMSQTEAQFQRAVLEFAKLHGWRCAHFRPAQNGKGQWRTAVAADGKGFPDLVLVRDRVLFVELKSSKGRKSIEQREWASALIRAGADWDCWQPKDWDLIERVLAGAERK